MKMVNNKSEISSSNDFTFENSSQKLLNDKATYNDESSANAKLLHKIDKSSSFADNSNVNDSASNSVSVENLTGDNDDDGNNSQQQIFTNSPIPHAKDRLQRKLRFYFMSPIDKWRAKRRFPLKLITQVIKVILVTALLSMFGSDMSRYLDHQGNIGVAFRQIFFSNWDPVREVMSYPPTAGPYAIYTKDDFFESVDYTIKQFSNISDMTIGSFGYATNTSIKNMSILSICKKFYSTGEIDPSNFYYFYDNKISYDCIQIDNIYPPGDERWMNFSSFDYFDKKNFSINFDRLLEVRLIFPLRDIYLNTLERYAAPECYNINVTILYDNTKHDGQMLISLRIDSKRHVCNGNLNDNLSSESSTFKKILNWTIEILCILSFMMCVRSLSRGQKLRLETENFFRNHSNKTLSISEKFEFLDLWIVMIIVNDVMILTGTIIKNTALDNTEVENEYYNSCAILLGIGNLLVWAGLLRYLEFFHQYNILILTIRKSLPNVLRFATCALLLYGGFCFAGWVVLGPYHIKFRSLSETSECLFALINGDDMFATFYITEYGEKVIIWWYSRLFLYIFISLFIYIVLSLFIAIIMDAYETIKDYYENGWPLSDLQKFIAECPDESTSSFYMMDPDDSIVSQIFIYIRRIFDRPNNYNY